MLSLGKFRRVVPRSGALVWSARALVAVTVLGLPRVGAAQMTEKKLVVWGSNTDGQGQLASSIDVSQLEAIAAGDFHNLVASETGTVSAWGWNGVAQVDVPSDLGEVSAIAAGAAHNLVITQAGEVKAWGWNSDGQGAIPVEIEALPTSSVTAISAGMAHSMVLTQAGQVKVWGRDSFGEGEVPQAIQDETVLAIAAGMSHNLVLTQAGEVKAWGDDFFDQNLVPPEVAQAPVKAIAAGSFHNLALTEAGEVLAWAGMDEDGAGGVPAQLDGVPVKAIAAGGDHNLALTEAGQVVAWGLDQDGQSTVPDEVNAPGVTVLAIAAGGSHSMALIEVPVTLGVGIGCREDSDCDSGHCVDSVCCDTACGGGDSNDCVSCLSAANGGQDGVCGAVEAGTQCGSDATDSTCNPADTCDGQGTCQTILADAGTECGNAATECSDQDTCDGQGACLVNDKPAETPCGDDSTTECNAADTCDGSGVCQDNFADAGTSCGESTGGVCGTNFSCNNQGRCTPEVAEGVGDCDDRVVCTTGTCEEEACVVDDSGCAVICRDAQFWSENPDTVTELFGQLDPIEVCGTRVNNADCAFEGLCIQDDEGSLQDQLRAELLVTAMNCKAYNGRSDCARSAIFDRFTECNNACVAGDANATSDCVATLRCFNSGGRLATGEAGGLICFPEEGNCSENTVEQNGMLTAVTTANAERCNEARSTVVGLSNAESCEQLPSANDPDQDGVWVEDDLCPGTAPGVLVGLQGCSVEQVCPCDFEWGRGEFMWCVRIKLALTQLQGLISTNERRALIGEAYDSECGERGSLFGDLFNLQLSQIDGLPDSISDDSGEVL